MADIVKVKKPVFRLADPNNPVTYQTEPGTFVPTQQPIAERPVEDKQFERIGDFVKEQGPISNQDTHRIRKSIAEYLAPAPPMEEEEGDEPEQLKAVTDRIMEIVKLSPEQREPARIEHSKDLDQIQNELMQRQLNAYKRFENLPPDAEIAPMPDEEAEMIDRLRNAIRRQDY